jgi:Flp pilus assembly protein TadD
MRFLFHLLVVPLGLLAAIPTAAQRDRDTYNPGNQTFEVSGQVNVAENNEPARNLPVRLERFNGGLVDQMSTDNRGRFRFTNLQRGFYKVIINAPGYGPAQQEADLTVVFRTYLLFSLQIDKGDSQSKLVSPTVLDVRVPTAAREEFDRGRSALSRKIQDEAVTHFQRAISLYPDFFDAHLLLGTSYMQQRQWEKAESSLSRALELRSNSALTLTSLGEVYWRQKRFELAEQTLLESLKLDDKLWSSHFTLGRLYWEKDNIAKAAPALGRTLQLRPDFGPAHLLAGNILLRVGQNQRALVEYQEYLRLEPKGEFAPQAQSLIQKLTKNP